MRPITTAGFAPPKAIDAGPAPMLQWIRLALILPLIAALGACGEGGARVTTIGDCEVMVERTVCLPSMPAPLCTQEAFVAVRKTSACLKRPEAS